MPAPTAQVDEEKALGHYGYLTKQVEDVQAAKGEQCKIIVLRPERFKLVCESILVLSGLATTVLC